MVIDLGKCFGCAACAIACKAENSTPPGIWWARVHHTETGKYPNAMRVNLPTVCMHCDNPPCVTVCPTGASHKRPDGIVAIDYDKCIGCKYCVQACPYASRQFLDKIKPYYPGHGLTPYEQYGYAKHQEGVVEKCTFCASNRIDAGNPIPACVQVCEGYARTFGDLDDPNSEVSQLIRVKKARPMKPELGTKPKVYYVGLTEDQ